METKVTTVEQRKGKWASDIHTHLHVQPPWTKGRPLEERSEPIFAYFYASPNFRNSRCLYSIPTYDFQVSSVHPLPLSSSTNKENDFTHASAAVGNSLLLLWTFYPSVFMCVPTTPKLNRYILRLRYVFF